MKRRWTILIGLALAGTSAAARGEEAPTPGAQRAEGSLDLVPMAMPAYQPETSWMLGAAAILVRQPPAGSGRKESQVQLIGAASVLGQYSLLLGPDWYLGDDAVQLAGNLGISRFPDYLYGIGNATPDAAKEAYTPVYALLELNPRWRIAPALYLGPALHVQYASMREVAAGGSLASGGVTGAGGGTTVLLGASGQWDTRDSALCPRAGALVRLDVGGASTGLGSDFGYGLARLDARTYLGIPAWRHVVALQALAELRSGEPPFYETGQLGGGAIMRGWYAGRYRDRQLWSAQVEYRAPLFWRVGAVAFGSAGGVARDPSGLLDAVQVAGGGGVRVAPSEKVPVNIRLDVAYGNDAAFYLNVGEAF